MAQKSGIFIYPHNCTDFSTVGMVGDITPNECYFEEEKNGMSKVTIRMPYDDLKRWQALRVGNIVKVRVPIRMPPSVKDGEYSDNAEIYRVVE